MPTYVYRRPDGTTFETFQKISAPALAVDPESGEPVERVISGGAGLQFKGSGFYLTDYGRQGSDAKTGESKSGESKTGESKTGESKGGAAKGESTGDAKSATPARTESPAPAKSSD